MDLTGETAYAIDPRVFGGARYDSGNPALIRWTPDPIQCNGRALVGDTDQESHVVVDSRKVICTWTEHLKVVEQRRQQEADRKAAHEAETAALMEWQAARREADQARREHLNEMFGEDAWRLPDFASAARMKHRDHYNGNITLETLTFLLDLANQKGRNAR